MPYVLSVECGDLLPRLYVQALSPARAALTALELRPEPHPIQGHLRTPQSTPVGSSPMRKPKRSWDGSKAIRVGTPPEASRCAHMWRWTRTLPSWSNTG